MKIFILTIIFLISSCGPQTDLGDGEIEYLIRAENNGFSVLIKKVGFRETKYHVSAYWPKKSVIKTNHTDMGHGYFQMEGAHLFRCLGDVEKARSVKLTWDVPQDWNIANSFGYGSKTQNINTSCRQLANSMFAGGPRLSLTPTRFGALAMSTDSFNATALVRRLEKNMKRVEEFWDDKPGSYFLVLVNRQIDGEPHKNGGSAHSNSFQLQLKGNETSEALDHLITHEYFHYWNGWIIKSLPVQDELDDLDIRWFIEGFTDYFAFKLSDTRRVEQPWQNVSLLELKRNYKSNDKYFDIPYAQGRVIAAHFEKQIPAYSEKSLRDFMLELLRRAKSEPGFYMSRKSFLQVMCEGAYFDCERTKTIIERYVVRGDQFKSQV